MRRVNGLLCEPLTVKATDLTLDTQFHISIKTTGEEKTEPKVPV